MEQKKKHNQENPEKFIQHKKDSLMCFDVPKYTYSPSLLLLYILHILLKFCENKSIKGVSSDGRCKGYSTLPSLHR